MPYWQVATTRLKDTEGGVVVVCDKCGETLTTPASSITLKDAKKVSKRHRCKK